MNEELKPYQDLSLQDTKGEEWQDISGYEDNYQISNIGRVKRLYRGGHCRTIKEKILKQYFSNRLTVTLHKEGIYKNIGITTLMRYSFLKEEQNSYSNEFSIYHKDNDPLNNCLTNLFLSHKPSELSSIQHKIQIAKKNNERIFKGVSKSRNGYRCRISLKEKGIDKQKSLYFKTETDAIHQYNSYIKEYDLKRKGN